jgi:hypothetical protein
MRFEMESRGWSIDAHDKTASVSGALRYMHLKGLIEKVGPGVYRPLRKEETASGEL